MIGQIVIWQVKEQKPFGYIVTNGKESALLHESQCEGELQVGDDVTVFLYHDHDGRMRATMKRPLITTSSYGWVEVVSISNIRLFQIENLETLDTTAFAVVFHFLGIPKNPIEFEKIL
ncbi:S1-like domain-containing RNA-binding protein, partial [Anoxybacillus flavithermus]|uniref:S1-like domain-containing RNA-binding protein n=1 Tax=Anoxybacillus flavithermus TaxID=33934 RepID=UPI001F5125DC